jgi:hypothetical protein
MSVTKNVAGLATETGHGLAARLWSRLTRSALSVGASAGSTGTRRASRRGAGAGAFDFSGPDSGFEQLEQRSLMSVTVTSFFPVEQVAVVGDPLTLRTSAWAQAGLAASTFWLDINRDRWWTPGVDRSLGDVFAPPGLQSAELTRQVTPDGLWPAQAQLMTDAVDVNGRWSGRPMAFEIPVTSRPIAASVTFSPSIVAPGEIVTLSAIVNSSTPISAVSFFVDHNEDRRWTQGVDEHIVDVFNPTPGFPNRYEANVKALWEWGNRLGAPGQLQKFTRLIGATVQTTQGAWSLPATSPLTLAPQSIITSFQATGTSTTARFTVNWQVFTAGGWIQVLPGGPNDTRRVNFYLDNNRNGVRDPGDTLVGAATTSGTQRSVNYSVNIPSGTPFPRQFLASVEDRRTTGNPNGPTAIAVHAALGTSETDPTVQRPLVSNLRAVAPVTRQFPTAPHWVEGEQFRVDVSTIPVAGLTGTRIESLTAFFDTNRNAKLDVGETIAQQINNPSPLQQMLFAVRGHGIVQIGFIARDSSGRSVALRESEARTFNVWVTRPPTLSNVTTTVRNDNGQRILDISVDAVTSAGTRSISGWLDADRNGSESGGDRTAISLFRSSGSLFNGRWTVSFIVTGLSGTFAARLTGSNFIGAVGTPLAFNVTV